MEQVQIRTDLALEARESVSEKEEHLHGVQVEEEYKEESEIKITRVTIESKNGARLLGKAMGTYVTLEAPNMAHPDEDYHEEIARELAYQIKSLLPKEKEQLSILIVGLGNREVTADSLGPRVVDNLTITRHMVMEFGNAAYEGRKLPLTSSLVPGVMAKTGMESQEIISGVVAQTHPDLVIVIDALAARSIKRLNRTIQISNAGINPGSGVGNYRNAIHEENLGVPVIALGVPTVVDAATIVQDAVFKDCTMEDQDFLDRKEKITGAMDELYNMYVTGKDVDYEIQQISHIICNAIHLALEL
ncbi:MAG: GPR endopeptidase [Lachnospiraceae bacterium]|nr:GPR endopeptidase [Lachnospiraceae bacterium]